MNVTIFWLTSIAGKNSTGGFLPRRVRCLSSCLSASPNCDYCHGCRCCHVMHCDMNHVRQIIIALRVTACDKYISKGTATCLLSGRKLRLSNNDLTNSHSCKTWSNNSACRSNIETCLFIPPQISVHHRLRPPIKVTSHCYTQYSRKAFDGAHSSPGSSCCNLFQKHFFKNHWSKDRCFSTCQNSFTHAKHKDLANAIEDKKQNAGDECGNHKVHGESSNVDDKITPPRTERAKLLQDIVSFHVTYLSQPGYGGGGY